MGWLESASVEIESRARVFWKMEYAVYDAAFVQEFGEVGDMTVGQGKRAVRFLKVRERDFTFPGLTKQAAVDKVTSLLNEWNYMGGTATHSTGGAYTVTATERTYHSEGWSAWMSEDALPPIA